MNYNKKYLRKVNDKKLLHKIGKQWVTISISLLSLLGIGTVTAHITANADNTNNVDNNNVKKQLDNQLSLRHKLIANHTNQQPVQTKPTNISIQKITQRANKLHSQILLGGVKQATHYNSNKAPYWDNAPKNIKQINTQSLKAINNLNHVPVNHIYQYKGMRVGRLNVPFHQVKINKEVLLHKNIELDDKVTKPLKRGSIVNVLRGYEIYGKDGNYYRYLINHKHNNYFITGNPEFNSFIEPHNYKFYQKRLNIILRHSTPTARNHIQYELKTLNHKHSTNYRNYLKLYSRVLKKTNRTSLKLVKIQNKHSLAVTNNSNDTVAQSNASTQSSYDDYYNNTSTVTSSPSFISSNALPLTNTSSTASENNSMIPVISSNVSSSHPIISSNSSSNTSNSASMKKSQSSSSSITAPTSNSISSADNRSNSSHIVSSGSIASSLAYREKINMDIKLAQSNIENTYHSSLDNRSVIVVKNKVNSLLNKMQNDLNDPNNSTANNADQNERTIMAIDANLNNNTSNQNSDKRRNDIKFIQNAVNDINQDINVFDYNLSNTSNASLQSTVYNDSSAIKALSASVFTDLSNPSSDTVKNASHDDAKASTIVSNYYNQTTNESKILGDVSDINNVKSNVTVLSSNKYIPSNYPQHSELFHDIQNLKQLQASANEDLNLYTSSAVTNANTDVSQANYINNDVNNIEAQSANISDMKSYNADMNNILQSDTQWTQSLTTDSNYSTYTKEVPSLANQLVSTANTIKSLSTNVSNGIQNINNSTVNSASSTVSTAEGIMANLKNEIHNIIYKDNKYVQVYKDNVAKINNDYADVADKNKSNLDDNEYPIQSIINKDLSTHPVSLITNILLNYQKELNNDVTQLSQIHQQVDANYLTATDNKKDKADKIMKDIFNLSIKVNNTASDMKHGIMYKKGIMSDLSQFNKDKRAIQKDLSEHGLKSKPSVADKITNHYKHDKQELSSLGNISLPNGTDNSEANAAVSDANNQLSDAYHDETASDLIQPNIKEVKRDVVTYINRERNNNGQVPIFEDSKYDDLVTNYHPSKDETDSLVLSDILKGYNVDSWGDPTEEKDTKNDKKNALEQAELAAHMLKLGYVANHSALHYIMPAISYAGMTFSKNKISDTNATSDPDYLGMNTEASYLQQLNYFRYSYGTSDFANRITSDLKYSNQSDLDDCVAYIISNNIDSLYSNAPDTNKFAIGLNIKPAGNGMLDVKYAIGPDIGEGKLVNAGSDSFQVELAHGLPLGHIQNVMLKNFMKLHHINNGKLQMCQLDTHKIPKSTKTINGMNGKKYTIIPASEILSDMNNGSADEITEGLTKKEKSTMKGIAEDMGENLATIKAAHPTFSPAAVNYCASVISIFGTVWGKASPMLNTLQQMQSMQDEAPKDMVLINKQMHNIQNQLDYYMENSNNNLPQTTPTFVIEH